ncbi:MAG: tRNA (guanosine(37)-N1)-methyltransferase TrmD [bacterium]
MLKINIITIFPDFFKTSVSYSILKRAQEKGLVEFNLLDLRQWSEDNYKTIDEHPYGGGAGMVMMLPPVYKALQSLKFPSNVILPSAKGKIWNQGMAKQFSEFNEMTFIVPHFEGIDERVVENLVNYEISIGPYVLSGGEIPTLSIIDSIVRLLPGVLGNPESIIDESYSEIIPNSQEAGSLQATYLEYPQYTKPSKFVTEEGKEWVVPEVLLSGDHKKIDDWRKNKKKLVKINC